MKSTLDDLLHELKEKGIPLSYQRMRVLEYLTQHLTHPTVEQIYAGLLQEIPTLSKTTVYNTLKILEKAGSVMEIPVEGNESHYDIDTKPHGHFQCTTCGTIFDFPVNMDSFTTEGLEEFQICDRHVYFKGTCPRCLFQTKEKNKGGK